MTPLLCACAVVITLETQKCRKRAPCSVEFNFFNNCDRQKRFSQIERRRADLQNVASDFLIFAWGLRPCAFFSMFLVTRPRSFWLKTKKKKKTEVHKIRAVERRYHARNTCTLHLQTPLSGRRNVFTVCEEEEEELSPSP